jgi:hypothetical protein
MVFVLHGPGAEKRKIGAINQSRALFVKANI